MFEVLWWAWCSKVRSVPPEAFLKISRQNRDVRRSVVGVMFEGLWRPCRGPLRGLSLNFRAPEICIDKSRLCQKMRTVIAVIFHPSRALSDSVRQSYDRFSVNAAQNPQTETALLARSSIKGRCSPFYREHRDHHARPYPMCKAHNRATPLSGSFRAIS